MPKVEVGALPLLLKMFFDCTNDLGTSAIFFLDFIMEMLILTYSLRQGRGAAPSSIFGYGLPPHRNSSLPNVEGGD